MKRLFLYVGICRVLALCGGHNFTVSYTSNSKGEHFMYWHRILAGRWSVLRDSPSLNHKYYVLIVDGMKNCRSGMCVSVEWAPDEQLLQH